MPGRAPRERETRPLSESKLILVLIDIRNAAFDAEVVFRRLVVVRIEPRFFEGDAFALVRRDVRHERDDRVAERDARIAARLNHGILAVGIFLNAPRPVLDLTAGPAGPALATAF